MKELTDRLLTHAALHETVLGQCGDEEQRQWAEDLREAAAQIVDLHRDAERYRWLRDNPRARLYEAGGFFRVENYSTSWEESVDAAIDAAMKGANAQVQRRP